MIQKIEISDKKKDIKFLENLQINFGNIFLKFIWRFSKKIWVFSGFFSSSDDPETLSGILGLDQKKKQKNPKKNQKTQDLDIPRKKNLKKKKLKKKNPTFGVFWEKSPKKPNRPCAFSLKKTQVEFGVFSLFRDFGDPVSDVLFAHKCSQGGWRSARWLPPSVDGSCSGFF